MANVDRIRALKAINEAYKKEDEQDNSHRAERVRKRKQMREICAREAAGMNLEDELASHVRRERLLAEEKRFRELEREKLAARMLREISQRLDDENGDGGADVTERSRLMALDALEDARKQAFSKDEARMATASHYLIRQSMQDLREKKLIKAMVALSKSNRPAVQQRLCKYQLQLLKEWAAENGGWSQKRRISNNEAPSECSDVSSSQTEVSGMSVQQAVIICLQNLSPSTDLRANVYCVACWEILTRVFGVSSEGISALTDTCGMLQALVSLSKSCVVSVRVAVAKILRQISRRFCRTHTALLLVKSGAVAAAIKLTQGDFASGTDSGSIDDEQVDRLIRTDVLALMSNLSRHPVVCRRLLSMKACVCIANCLEWDRYSSRNRHESDLFQLSAVTCFVRLLRVATLSDKHSLFTLPDALELVGAPLQNVLGRIVERTYESILLPTMPSWTALETVVALRAGVLESFLLAVDGNSESACALVLRREGRQQIFRQLLLRIERERERIQTFLPEKSAITLEDRRNMSRKKLRQIQRSDEARWASREAKVALSAIRSLDSLRESSLKLLGILDDEGTTQDEQEEVRMQREKTRKEIQEMVTELHKKLWRFCELFRANFKTFEEKLCGSEELCDMLETLIPGQHGTVAVTERALLLLAELWREWKIMTPRVATCFARGLYVLCSSGEDGAARALRCSFFDMTTDVLRTRCPEKYKHWRDVARSFNCVVKHGRLVHDLLRSKYFFGSLIALSQQADDLLMLTQTDAAHESTPAGEQWEA